MTGDPVLHTCVNTGTTLTGAPPPICPACNPRPFTFTPIAAAWECTRCKRINAPHVSQCSCAPASGPTPWVSPVGPDPYGPVWITPLTPPYTVTCTPSGANS